MQLESDVSPDGAYTNAEQDLLLRWSPSESPNADPVTSAGDVFMFGFLLYEIYSHGKLPYQLAT